MAMKKQKRGSALKSSVKRRTLNQTAGGPVAAKSQRTTKGTPGQEQDIQRRLGNFEAKGEHARVGGRTSGIVGQTSKAFRTDNKLTKSKQSRKHGKGSR
jgi:hypothetical protein